MLLTHCIERELLYFKLHYIYLAVVDGFYMISSESMMHYYTVYDTAVLEEVLRVM